MLRMPQMKKKTGISRSGLYDRINPKSPRFDREFPLPVRLGNRSIAWIEAEVDAWLIQRRDASRKAKNDTSPDQRRTK
jgi:prophage regulatory protein